MEVWVTNKVTDVVVSWSKYFNVTHPDLLIFNPLFIRYTYIYSDILHPQDRFYHVMVR
ncbi:hypothetical protein ARALYDRAFT_894793 [Arabidopsis lyrata subsp. lyrata]|uniref:Uncharacterized protein n=1 Tax=Arabidopsis lyrata subsp. lyrata TaxID=81972 RepID=D7KXM0_ARALL|nr:hypothetical protein ARALYDRAFT_894793 [Arabidopsis lyrata subsp. lyrata]